MDVGILGINHKSSPLDVRENLSRIFHRVFQQSGNPFASVLLSTCNRTELYFSSSDLPETHIEILRQLRAEFQTAFEHHLYSYFGQDCFTHLSKVTSGVDSAIFGEDEVQRQVKVSYESSRISQSLPSSLHYIFQKSLKVGKEMRTSFLMPKNITQLPQLLLQLVKGLDLRDPKILFVGNSEINRRMRAVFQGYETTLCTRMVQDKAINWDLLHTWNHYDVIIFGTYHHEYIIKGSDIQTVRNKSLIIDLSVPRSVDPILDVHPKITLYNIEELSQMIVNITETNRMQLEDIIEGKIARSIALYYEKRKNKEQQRFNTVSCV